MASSNRFLQHALIEEILCRLGLDAPPQVDFEGLCTLYRKWCHSVPFDNLFKRLYVRTDENVVFPGSDESLFFRNWLTYGTGGTCWSGNGALQILLASLGFNAKRRRGTMLIGRDRGPNHGSVTVELDERCFLVDASMLHDTPLELHAEKHREIRHGGWGLRSRPDGEDWLIWWRPLHLPQGCFCRIEGREVERREWLAHNDLTRTVSPFNASLYVRKNIGDEVVGVEHGARTVFYSDGRVARERLRHSRILECLSAELGYAPELLARLPCDDFDS